MPRPYRVLISKIGLDGHDRGAKLIVRNLRDAGMEVIYTGLWQTPAATVHAALQEDVDVVGVSLLSAAHMTIMPDVKQRCAAAGIGDLPVIVGGIIPEEDGAALRAAGIDGVFNPGTPMAAIVDAIRDLGAQRRERRERDEAVPDVTTTAGLPRALTQIATGDERVLDQLPQPQHKSVTIGITGAPGVGKSTFIGKLTAELRRREHRVAVVAVDPSSPITGGAVLGDRLRMMSKEPDDGLFIRSLASMGVAGGLAPHCAEIAQVLTAAGYEIVLIETVGAGQNDVQIRDLTPNVLLLQMPGAGDAIQFVKAGVIEIATGVVMNKADLDGADTAMRQLRDALSDDRPIWEVSSVRTEGLGPVCDWIEKLEG